MAARSEFLREGSSHQTISNAECEASPIRRGCNLGGREESQGRMWFATPANNKVGYFYLAAK